MPKHKLPPWLRPKTPAPSLSVGVGWYTEEEWSKVRAAAVDQDRFEATYAEWLSMAEEALVTLRASGVQPEKTYLNAESLLAWCLAHGLPNDAASRSRYVAEGGGDARRPSTAPAAP
jgi:hypothetical protein